MDRSLTMHLGLVVRVPGLVVPGLVVLGLVVPVRGDRVIRVVRGLVDPAVLVAPAVPDLAALGDRVIRVIRVVRDLVGPAVLVALAVRVTRVALGGRVIRVVRDLVAPADRAIRVVRDLVALAVLGLVALAVLGLVGLVRRGLVVRVIRVVRDLVALAVLGLVGLVRRGLVVRVIRVIRVVLGPVDLEGPAGPVDLVGLVDLVARRLLTCNTVTTTGVVRSGVARGMHPTASARRVTVRRLRLPRTDSGGTVDHPPERRRPTGTGHRLLAAGTDRRLLAAGTPNGMGRRATSAGRRLITGRSTTTATTPLQCSIRCSVDGDSGSSATGFRCTDLTSTGLPSSSKAGGQLHLGWALETAVKVCRAA